MLNLSLLYWASEETGDPRFRHIAMLHADTAQKYFVRPDGSVNHIIEFNPETGEFCSCLLRSGLHRGLSWTRGQGWGVYGFMISYIHTGKQEYFDTAKRIAALYHGKYSRTVALFQLISDSRRSRHGRIPAQHALLQMD